MHTGCGIVCKEWKHVDIDRINSVKDVLSATIMLIAIRKLADRDGNANV